MTTHEHSLNAAVPHLTTALTGPTQLLENNILNNQAKIESWFRQSWRQFQAPFYSSVDIRNSGYKICPVDTNLFPAGFNNLNPAFESISIQAVQVFIEQLETTVDRILIIAEEHTRNKFYLQHLQCLKQIIEKAGFEVSIGSLKQEHSLTIATDDQTSLLLEPIEERDQKLYVGDYCADLIILNNDLSAGSPAILMNITQPIMPPVKLGWTNRLKSTHFGFYQTIAREFAELINIDPWLIDPLFQNCGEVDFMKQEGLDCLSSSVDNILTLITKHYAAHSITDDPFVVIKADAGTYGMGVMTVKSTDQIQSMNRKMRTRMSTTKDGHKISKVIIQEGVYTHETWQGSNMVAEPVVYMIGHRVIGGFYRVHRERSSDQNLNAPGMHFEPLAFDNCCISPDKSQEPRANRFYTYGVIARLAALAATHEIKDMLNL